MQGKGRASLGTESLSPTVPCLHQEPGPAKMAVTSSNIPSAEKVPTTKSTLWQEEMRGKESGDVGSSISPAQSPVQGAASSLKDPILDNKEGKVMPLGSGPGHPTLVSLLEQELERVDLEVSANLILSF